MIVATWNVNSVRIREARLLRWLARHQPDVVCLQELKCVDEEFPREAVRGVGYHCEVHGQRTYNGVAILSRSPMGDVVRGLGRKDLDDEARYLAATIDRVRIHCVYVPAGGENRQSSKYPVKIRWLRALLDRLRGEGLTDPMVVCGDFNIAPDPIDLASPDKWRDSAVFNEELTEIFREIENIGMSDCFRLSNKEAGQYTWWDYNDLGYQRNEGLRIDHVLMPSALADRCYRCWIDWQEREGTKPSDHAPVVADFDWWQSRGRDLDASSSASRSKRLLVPDEPIHGEVAAREFVRSQFADLTSAMEDGALVRVRWASGFEEILRWNYFPAGARQWTFDGAGVWFELTDGQDRQA